MKLNEYTHAIDRKYLKENFHSHRKKLNESSFDFRKNVVTVGLDILVPEFIDIETAAGYVRGLITKDGLFEVIDVTSKGGVPYSGEYMKENISVSEYGHYMDEYQAELNQKYATEFCPVIVTGDPMKRTQYAIKDKYGNWYDVYKDSWSNELKVTINGKSIKCKDLHGVVKTIEKMKEKY